MSSINQLEYAIAVDTHRHFARAAKACFVTQPTLSAQLAKFEDEIGVVIFDRSAQPIIPTDEGEAVLAQARIVVAEFRKIQAIATGATNDVVGELVIGVIPTIAPYLLPLFLEGMSKAHPKLKLDIREMTTAQIVEALGREAIDVGILAIPVDGITYATLSLYSEPFYLYVHRNHELAKLKSVSPTDIDGRDMWLLEEGHCLRGQILQACKLKGRKAALGNVRFESGSVETLKRLVSQGLGYTLVPHLATELEAGGEDDIKIIAFDAPMPARDVGLMFRRTQLKRPAIDALAKSIRESLPRSLVTAEKKTKTLPVQ
jgi:LysR family transcriptional regulator, hydrogen peroxide-inducible genes activator